MLKFTKRQINTRTLVFIILAAIAVLLLTGYFLFNKSPISEPLSNQSKETKEGKDPTINEKSYQKDADTGAAQKGVEGIETSDKTGASAAFPTTKPDLEVTITSTDQRNNTLFVNTRVTPDAPGKCTIELSQDQKISATRTTTLAETKCVDSAIDVTSLAPGSWNVTVKVFVGQNTATATSVATLR